MVNQKVKIVLDNEAKNALKEAYNYIKKDSLQKAEKARNQILESIKSLIKNPHKYARINIGWIKIFLIARLKLVVTELLIMYRLMKSELFVLGIRK